MIIFGKINHVDHLIETVLTICMMFSGITLGNILNNMNKQNKLCLYVQFYL
jgi:hypothetical protein